MKPTRLHRTLLLITLLAALCLTPRLQAADGTWTNTEASTSVTNFWSEASNWDAGIIADGVDSTAYFTSAILSTENIGVDTDRTIGNLVIDVPGTSRTVNFRGTYESNTVLNLEVSSGMPLISYTNTSPSVYCAVVATNGFNKWGSTTRILTLRGDGNLIGGMITNLYGSLTFSSDMSGISAGFVLCPDGTDNNQTFTFQQSATNWTIPAGKIIQVGPDHDDVPFAGTSSIRFQYRTTSTATNDSPLYVGRNGIFAADGSTGCEWVQNADVSVNAQSNSYAQFIVGTRAVVSYAGATPIKLEPGSGGSGSASLSVLAAGFGTATLGQGTFITGQPFESTVTDSAGGLAQVILSGGRLVLGADMAQLTTGANPVEMTISDASGATTNYLSTIDTAGFSTTLGAAISGAGTLLKMGDGSLTLTSPANAFTGNTLIYAGTLALSGSGSLATSPAVVVSGGAALDFSGLTAPFEIAPGQTLSNDIAAVIYAGGDPDSATLAGSVNAATGHFGLQFDGIKPALILTNGTLTLTPTCTFLVDSVINYLTVGSYKLVSTNAGGLVQGDVPGVTMTGVPIEFGKVASLSIVDGELYLVVADAPATPPTLTLVATNGTTLDLSWPEENLGWKLQMQTNTLEVGISTNWFDIPGSESVTSTNLPIDMESPAVFLRLVAP